MTAPTYAPIADPRVAVLVTWLSETEREGFEESAGIRQYDGLLAKDEAERQAILDVLARRPRPCGLRVFRLTLADGSCQWVLADDLSAALACLYDLGGIDIAEEPAEDVLNQQFGGLAFLVTTA